MLSQKIRDSKTEKSIRKEELELPENGAALRALPRFSVHEFRILETRADSPDLLKRASPPHSGISGLGK